jgi:hypothetical protein
MASFAEAMEWHTKRFLGNGPGSGVDAYPKLADDGSVKWYTFTDGKLTSSPMNSQPQATQPAKQPKFAYSDPQYPPEPAPERDDYSLTARNLCRIACTRSFKANCPGSYGFDARYDDAYCGLEDDTLFPVSRSQYRLASTD